jgi:hypothetical protein
VFVLLRIFQALVGVRGLDQDGLRQAYAGFGARVGLA